MRSLAELDEALSRPTADDASSLAALEGDLLIVGVSGKMGPSLAALARRAARERRRIFGAARFSDPAVREKLDSLGVETIACDLLDRQSVDALPTCPNVLFMAGQKFGTSGNQPLTWAVNACAPANVAERFPSSRIVAFSTGNVYPLTAAESDGPTESDPTGPIGEYAWSALARERVLQYYSARYGTPMAILRLNYAIDLRYGVLRDIAEKVYARKPIDLTMGFVNVIWQRDANSVALRALEHCQSPPFILNLTGSAKLSVRRIAEEFGRRFDVEPRFEGREAATALLSNAALCSKLFGPETVGLEQMLDWTAEWIRSGGESLGKPTHFEQRQGAF